MSIRIFVDSAGNEWQAFDVVPRTEERRRRERRIAAGAAQPPFERRQRERRVSLGAIARLAGCGNGWLCFEHGAELRRLSPIPEDWNRCSEESLAGYCRAARPARVFRAQPENESAAATPRR